MKSIYHLNVFVKDILLKTCKITFIFLRIFAVTDGRSQYSIDPLSKIRYMFRTSDNFSNTAGNGDLECTN